MTHTLLITYRTPAGEITGNLSAEAGAGHELDVPFASDATDAEINNLSLDLARLKGVALLATADCTVKTNNPSTPDDTLTLAANVPMAWVDGGPGECPFTDDVSALYVTATAATAGTLRVRILHDPTP